MHARTHLVLAVHGVEGQVLQRELFANLEAREIQQKVNPLSRGEVNLPYHPWSIQEAAIRGYYPIGEELVATDSRESEAVEASVGPIEKPEAGVAPFPLEGKGGGPFV